MSAQPEYPAGPCPPKEQIMNHIKSLFQEVGPHSLTMKILRLRLSSIYKIDFKEHTQQLSNWVQDVIGDPSMNTLMNESAKEQGKKVGGTRKSKSTTKKARDDDKASKKDEKKKKKHRAEGEPKRGLSGFMFFNNEVRPAVAEEIKAVTGKNDIGATGKKIGEMWGLLSAQDKVKYDDLAAKDKERYKTELEAWTAAGGKKESGSKKDKKKKDENKPKRATTAYFVFMNEVAPALRAELKEKNGKVDVAVVSKQVGVMWNALDAAGKAKYEKAVAEDKLRYERECKERGYTSKAKPVGADAAAAAADSSSDSSSSSSDSDDE